MSSLAKRHFLPALLCLGSLFAPLDRGLGQEVPPSFAELKRAGAANSSYREATQAIPTTAPRADVETFAKRVRPILQNACVSCHGEDAQEGNVRIDTLDPDLLHGDDIAWWLEVFAVLSKGEMPPADANEISEKDRAVVVDWLSQELQSASRARREEGERSSFRRMTRYEYNYALQDLLGLPYEFGRDLPPEAESEDGFLNSAEMLHMSVSQLGMYREAAAKALRRATVQGDRPAPLFWHVSMLDAAAEQRKKYEQEQAALREKFKAQPEQLEKMLEDLAQRRRSARGLRYQDLESGWTAPVQWNYHQAKYAWKPTVDRQDPPAISPHVVVVPPRQRLIVELGERMPDEGLLRVRVRASWVGESPHPPSLQLEFGWQASNDSAAAVRISDRDLVVDSREPKFYQWEAPLGEIYPRNDFRKTEKLGGLPNPSELIKLVNSSVAQGDLQIDYIEVSAPLYHRWPPESHQRVFPAAVMDVAKGDEQRAARAILQPFMSKAWRRPISADEVEQKLAMFQAVRPECDSFQDAMLEVLATVIASPKFLYLTVAAAQEGPQPLSQHELATRLSMFLWCSVPDAELRALADAGTLSEPAALENQVRRMLRDPKARRFSEQFVRQWLGMQLLDYLQVDRKVYRQFDPTLKEAMQKEPVAFFHELLTRNHSVLDFLHADFAMVNERLARHYGIKDVYGNEMRRVRLTPDVSRGGLLTQAGLLAMNSDGKDSHPLKRGIWLLESLLNDPPPPPPPAVPEIDLADPEIAKLTLKERIEDHRNQAACRSCHMKIDPWGIAFENYDAIGSWRTEVQGKPVDATSVLFNQQPLNGMDGLKRFLLENRQDQFVRAMVHKLTTYAVGRPLTFGDHSSIDQIAARVRGADDGLATMVLAIVRSPIFQTK